MVRRDVKDVLILHHTLEKIAVIGIKNSNLATAQNYETIDNNTNMKAGRAFGLMQIAVKQTARAFDSKSEGVVCALEEIFMPAMSYTLRS